MLVEVGQSARSYCELSGRTIPVIGDVVVSLVNMGISLQGIEGFAKRDGRQIISMPAQQQQQKQLNLLQAGTKSQHPAHILSYLPLFPDPHAYVRTPVMLYCYHYLNVVHMYVKILHLFRHINNQ